MSFFSFFRSNKEKVCLLLDIGNGSITGALVLFKPKEKPLFLCTSESRFNIPDVPNSSKLVDDVTVLLNSLIENLIKNGLKHKYWIGKKFKVVESLVVFSSPWFISKTKHLILSKETPFIISPRFIDGIVENEEKVFLAELGEEAEFEMVEKSVVHTRINGYNLDNSLGKKTKNLDAYLHIALVSRGVIDRINTVIQRNIHIPREKISIHTFPLISFTVIRDVFSAISDFLIMDITAEVTDLTLIQEDVIKGSVSIPSGKNFILRQIAKAFDVTFEIAESILHLFFENKLDEQGVLKMEDVIVNVEKEWSIYLENGLSELSLEMTLPSNVYLTSDIDVADIYKDFLKLSKTDSTAIFRKNLNMTYIDKEKMESFYLADESLNVNVFIAILAVFYNKVIKLDY